ncbi:hypothetical protein BACERE00185_03737 [Bacillus mobilis]|uniref:Uncharacterized protein n=1 Tax=Bacillus mobilis TaxID=2026190 RepID=A0A1Y6A5G2_9BACI|nr:hypothetical protein BACERE00185_03737 [Bacillus mobilis]
MSKIIFKTLSFVCWLVTTSQTFYITELFAPFIINNFTW